LVYGNILGKSNVGGGKQKDIGGPVNKLIKKRLKGSQQLHQNNINLTGFPSELTKKLSKMCDLNNYPRCPTYLMKISTATQKGLMEHVTRTNIHIPSPVLSQVIYHLSRPAKPFTMKSL
jgi:hypothetical protein